MVCYRARKTGALGTTPRPCGSCRVSQDPAPCYGSGLISSLARSSTPDWQPACYSLIIPTGPFHLLVFHQGLSICYSCCLEVSVPGSFQIQSLVSFKSPFSVFMIFRLQGDANDSCLLASCCGVVPSHTEWDLITRPVGYDRNDRVWLPKLDYKKTLFLHLAFSGHFLWGSQMPCWEETWAALCRMPSSEELRSLAKASKYWRLPAYSHEGKMP